MVAQRSGNPPPSSQGRGRGRGKPTTSLQISPIAERRSATEGESCAQRVHLRVVFPFVIADTGRRGRPLAQATTKYVLYRLASLTTVALD
jgi:hypothetical protein